MPRTASPAPLPASPPLSDSQLKALAELGEERTAEVGETLFRIGDQRYPFIAIVEGEVSIRDPAGHEIVSHGASKFLGELSLLSGQAAFLSAVVTQPLRYIAVDRDVLRALLYEDGPLSDLLLSTFIARREALQRVQDVGLEIVGPRSSQATMRMLDFLRMNRLPFTWHETRTGWIRRVCPSCAFRVARTCSRHRRVRSLVPSGSVASSGRARKSTCSWSGPVRPGSAPRCTGPPRGSTRW